MKLNMKLSLVGMLMIMGNIACASSKKTAEVAAPSAPSVAVVQNDESAEHHGLLPLGDKKFTCTVTLEGDEFQGYGAKKEKAKKAAQKSCAKKHPAKLCQGAKCSENF